MKYFVKFRVTPEGIISDFTDMSHRPAQWASLKKKYHLKTVPVGNSFRDDIVVYLEYEE